MTRAYYLLSDRISSQIWRPHTAYQSLNAVSSFQIAPNILNPGSDQIDCCERATERQCWLEDGPKYKIINSPKMISDRDFLIFLTWEVSEGIANLKEGKTELNYYPITHNKHSRQNTMFLRADYHSTIETFWRGNFEIDTPSQPRICPHLSLLVQPTGLGHCLWPLLHICCNCSCQIVLQLAQPASMGCSAAEDQHTVPALNGLILIT